MPENLRGGGSRVPLTRIASEAHDPDANDVKCSPYDINVVISNPIRTQLIRKYVEMENRSNICSTSIVRSTEKATLRYACSFGVANIYSFSAIALYLIVWVRIKERKGVSVLNSM